MLDVILSVASSLVFDLKFWFGLALGAVVVVVVPSAYSWVSAKLGKSKPTPAATANAIMTSLSTLDINLSSSVKADLANIMTNILTKL